MIRGLTKEDVVKMYGKPFEQATYGIASEIDGELIGVCGVLHTIPMQAYSTLTDKILKNKRELIHGIRWFRKILEKYQSDVVAIEKGDPMFLKHVGFEFVCESEQGDVYRWQAPSHT